MPKFLLDKFIKSKLDEYTVSYDQNAWKSLESKLDAGQSSGFWKSLSIAPKVIGSVAATGILGCLVYYIVTKNDSDSVVSSTKTIAKTEVINAVDPNKAEVNIPKNTEGSNNPKPIATANTTKLSIKPISVTNEQVYNPVTISTDDSEAVSSTSKAIANIVVESITSDLVVASEANFIESKPVQETEAVEEKQKEEYTRPKPIPAKDVFNKKKRRGLLYLLGIRR